MDYEAYSKDVSGVDGEWKSAEGNEALHPVVNVSWEDATAFCAWLTRKERAEGKIGPKDEYRLPSDHEWSCAIGIGSKENAGTSPEDKSQKLPGYPWGNSWPPPNGAGNFGGNAGYGDAYDRTAPVGSFRVDQNGLYDLSGNVYEWCLDWYSSGQEYRVLRGGSWDDTSEVILRSSCRFLSTPRGRNVSNGFRCVLEAERTPLPETSGIRNTANGAVTALPFVGKWFQDDYYILFNEDGTGERDIRGIRPFKWTVQGKDLDIRWPDSENIKWIMRYDIKGKIDFR